MAMPSPTEPWHDLSEEEASNSMDTGAAELCVFIVEDMGLLRRLMRERLEEIPNVRVIGEAANAADALEAIFRLTPDVVILDLHLPAGSGLHVLEQIKAPPSSPRVVVFTAHAHEPLRSRCLALGADGVFDKAYQTEDMYALIERWAQEH